MNPGSLLCLADNRSLHFATKVCHNARNIPVLVSSCCTQKLLWTHQWQVRDMAACWETRLFAHLLKCVNAITMAECMPRWRRCHYLLTAKFVPVTCSNYYMQQDLPELHMNSGRWLRDMERARRMRNWRAYSATSPNFPIATHYQPSITQLRHQFSYLCAHFETNCFLRLKFIAFPITATC